MNRLLPALLCFGFFSSAQAQTTITDVTAYNRIDKNKAILYEAFGSNFHPKDCSYIQKTITFSQQDIENIKEQLKDSYYANIALACFNLSDDATIALLQSQAATNYDDSIVEFSYDFSLQYLFIKNNYSASKKVLKALAQILLQTTSDPFHDSYRKVDQAQKDKIIDSLRDQFSTDYELVEFVFQQIQNTSGPNNISSFSYFISNIFLKKETLPLEIQARLLTFILQQPLEEGATPYTDALVDWQNFTFDNDLFQSIVGLFIANDTSDETRMKLLEFLRHLKQRSPLIDKKALEVVLSDEEQYNKWLFHIYLSPNSQKSSQVTPEAISHLRSLYDKDPQNPILLEWALNLGALKKNLKDYVLVFNNLLSISDEDKALEYLNAISYLTPTESLYTLRNIDRISFSSVKKLLINDKIYDGGSSSEYKDLLTTEVFKVAHQAKDSSIRSCALQYVQETMQNNSQSLLLMNTLETIDRELFMTVQSKRPITCDSNE